MVSSQMIPEIAKFALDFLEAKLVNQHFLAWVQLCLALSGELGWVLRSAALQTFICLKMFDYFLI